jgi:hypothetical protein
MSTQKAKFSRPMVGLATITLILSSYGLFELAHVFGAMPAPFAILAVAGFDLTAIAAGNHAMTVARDGDSAGPWGLIVVGAAGVSAVLQFMHTRLAGQSWAIGVMMAMFPLATVILFEGTLRRAHRLNGRITGRVAQPRATFELMQWLVYPRATWWAFRRSVADRSLGGNAAFILGIEMTTTVEPEYVPPARREFEFDYARISGGGIRELSGPESGSEPESAAPAPDTRKLSEVVRDLLPENGWDPAATKTAVLAVRPEANPDTVRRTIQKESGLRSA